jgi:hypothetical protein
MDYDHYDQAYSFTVSNIVLTTVSTNYVLILNLPLPKEGLSYNNSMYIV